MATQIVNNIKDIEISLKRLGLWLFIVSDISFFVALVSSRFFIYGTNTPSEINQILGLSLTILLLASSLTAYRAEVASVNQNKKMVLRNLLITIIIGLIFLVGVAFEWYVALQHEITWPSKPFGTVLVTLTGVHAFHVFTDITNEAPISDYVNDNELELEIPVYVEKLTKREGQALKLLSTGMNIKDISKVMTISQVTARNHIFSVMNKLGAKTQLQAVIKAAQLKVL